MKKLWSHITTKKLLLLLLLLFLVVSGFLLFFINLNSLPHDPNGEIKLAIIKGLLDVLLVAIIGGMVAAVFKAHERNEKDFRNQLQRKDELSNMRVQKKIDFIKQLGEYYRTAKSTRRKLRTKGLRAFEQDQTVPLDNAQLDFYQEQMDVINDIQLELEGLKAEAEIPLIFENKEFIAKQLEEMEKYLGKIHSEFEDHNQSLRNESVPRNLDTIEFLKEFTFSAGYNFVFKKIEKEHNYGFVNNFSEPYYKILTNLL